MEPTTHNVSHSKNVLCNEGDIVTGNFNVIRCTGVVTVTGSHNKIYSNNSSIYGNHNKVFGAWNVITGSHNKARGQCNNCIGSFNKTIEDGVVRAVRDTRHVAYMPRNDTVTSSVHHGTTTIRTSETPSHHISNITSDKGSCLTIMFKPTVVSSPKFPATEDLRHDEEVAADESETTTCVICMERKRKCLVRPCNHFSLCIACSKSTLEQCPVCRTKITSIERAFL